MTYYNVLIVDINTEEVLEDSIAAYTDLDEVIKNYMIKSTVHNLQAKIKEDTEDFKAIYFKEDGRDCLLVFRKLV